MRRRRPQRASAGQDRWLISYADFMTLLFALFVVLFATSNEDKSKARRVSEAVNDAFGGQHAHLSGPAKPGKPENPSMRPPSKSLGLEPLLKVLVSGLQPEIRSGEMNVHVEQRGIVVSLSQASFFPSGGDSVDPAKFATLGKVADDVASLPNQIRLEGHTDSIPIHTPRFRSNWDLSSARAIAMMQLFHDRWHIAAGRLAVTGYAETVPIDSNETETGRARNRRVDIVILNGAETGPEPKKQN